MKPTRTIFSLLVGAAAVMTLATPVFAQTVPLTTISDSSLLGGGGALTTAASIPTPGAPTFDLGSFLRETATLIQSNLTQANTAITANNSAFQFTKSTTLNPLAYAVSQAALQAVVNSTVRWINSGFNGSPSFVTNLNQTLMQVGDAQANTFLKQLSSNGSINSPFQSQVASAVSTNYLQSTGSNGFFNQNPFTLGSVSSNPSAFLAGGTSGFAQGGFNAWIATAETSANNPYGATLLASQALNSQVTGAQKTQQTELQWGNGFLSYRGNCQTSTTGQTMAGTASSAAAGAAVGSTTQTFSADSGGGGSTITPTATTPAATTGGTTSLSGSSGCQSQNIITPGGAISNSLYKSLGSGVDSLINAKQFDQIVSALLGQLVNHVLSPSGLSGVSSSAAANTTTTSSASAVDNTLSANFATTLSSLLTNLQSFQTSWNTIDQAALAAQTALQNSGCSVNAQATIASTVQPVLNTATTELSNAATTINAVIHIQNELPPTNSTTDETAALAQVNSDYSALLSAPTTPQAPQDFNYAAQQSVDSTNTGQPTSLLTEMNQITSAAQSCGATTIPNTTTTTTTGT